jgi:Glycosyl hydrolase catalytic core/Concanavalin A-like lectin/glucanases superfamily/Putative Ig domain
MNRNLAALLAALSFLPLLAAAQTLDLQDTVRTFAALTNTTVTMTGRAELRVTGAGDPIPGCVIHLNSSDAWLLLTAVSPSQVASSFLGRVRVDGANAVLNSNVRVVQYAQGAVVIPQSPDFAPLEVFDGRHFAGHSRKLDQFVKYDSAQLGAMATNIASFKLKRGYQVTFATAENGTGTSRNYVAQDGDLEIGRLPAALENNIRFVRIFPWRWTSKKGVAGNIEPNLDVDWLYNWNLDRNSPLDWEYIAIRQVRYWPSMDQDWKARGSTHLLGYNEPDRPDQANMTVAQAISSWPDLLGTGLRVGAPAVSDGGRSSWLYPFITDADAAGLRVDFVPIHYYQCVNPADPAAAANQMYDFLKATYDTVKRPLWITEWNNGANWTGCGDPTAAQQQAAIAAMIDMLDNTPFVERYAPYNWVEDVRRLVWDDNSLTAAGITYRDNAAPLGYRQQHRDSGAGRTTRYRFDGNTHDDGGNGQDAMRVGAPTFAPGKFGQALVLDGTNDYLQLPSNVGNSTDFSFAAWVLWNGGGEWQRIFDLGDLLNQKYAYLSPDVGSGGLRFTITDNGWNSEQRLNAPALATGVWTHVAVTLAGDTGKLFVNGAVVASSTSMTFNPSALGVQYNYLGHSRFSADPKYKGRIDDARFLTSALSDAEVAALAAGAPPAFITNSFTAPDATSFRPYSASIVAFATNGVGARTFDKMDGPSWLSVSTAGGLSGTPGSANAGTNHFVLRVTDDAGGAQLAQLFINVTNAPALPITASANILNSARDAEQAANGTVTLDSTDLELVEDAATSTGPQTVGLRFDLQVPQGAIVTEARIQFKADETQNVPTALTIATEAADNSATFTTNSGNLSTRTRSSLVVPWQPVAWSAGEAGPTQLTPNLAGLVQEVVSRPGWQAGNAIAFLINGTGHRTAESFDKAGGVPAVLTYTFLTPTTLSIASASVSHGTNDAEQAASGAVTLNSSDLELVNDGAAGDQIVGLRFENFALPVGAVIASASLQFSADEAQSETTALTLRAQAAGFAPGFTTSANNLGARPLTTASVAWSPAAWATVGERGPLQRTPDLAALVGEVIAHPGWTNGSALAFLITGTGHRTADAADEAGGVPAALTVNYWTEFPLGSYARWASALPPVISPNFDLDGDGYDHFSEYALGLDPTVPERGALQLSVEADSLQLTYARPSAVLDVTYQVEWTDVLRSTWSSAGVTQQIIGDDGTARTIRATLPKGATGQRFVRLKTTQR